MRGAKFDKVDGDVEPKEYDGEEQLHGRNMTIVNTALEDVAGALSYGDDDSSFNLTSEYNDACLSDPLEVQRRIDAL